MRYNAPIDQLRLEFLRECGGVLPNHVGDSLCRRLAPQLSAVLEMEPGETLAHVGGELQSIYIPGNGVFKSVMLGEDGTHQVVYFYWPGELMEFSGLALRRFLTDIVAVVRSRVYAFTLSDIERLGQKDPSVLELLLAHASERLAESEKSQFMLGSLSAAQRVAFLLTDTLQRCEHMSPTPRLSMPMSRADLASYLGIAPETVSRLLGWFQKEGLIRILPGRIVEVTGEVTIHEILVGAIHFRSPLSRALAP